MVVFKQSASPRLYVEEQSGPGQPWLAYVLPQGETPSQVELHEALRGGLQGSFLFAGRAPAPDRLDDVCRDVINIIGQSPSDRGFLWLTSLENITVNTVQFMGMSGDGTRVTAGLYAELVKDLLYLDISNGSGLDLPDGSTVLTIRKSATGWIQFKGSSAPDTTEITQIELPFEGAQRGSLVFDAGIKRISLAEQLRWGFEFVYPVSNRPDRTHLAGWYPLADGSAPVSTDYLSFTITIDPADVWNNDRTAFTFGPDAVLYSYYRTNLGYMVKLTPVVQDGPDTARLVFALGVENSRKGNDFLLSPSGDFAMQVDQPPEGALPELLCGLSGTETIRFRSGDRLRFTPGQAAYVSQFPIPPSSPVGPPVDPNASILDDTFLTSWASVRRPLTEAAATDDGLRYHAQPHGASLYGKDGVVHLNFTALLGPNDPGFPLPATDSLLFPLVPYAGVVPGPDQGNITFNAADFEQIESQVIATARRARIAAACAKLGRPAASGGRPALSADQSPTAGTTPSGLIAQWDDAGNWLSVLLAQNTTPALTRMEFLNPTLALQQALQTNQLFLVAANATNLGGPTDGGPAFHNTINIEDWYIQANVGQKNRYNDYRNVLIIKGRKGKLCDLVQQPDLWTLRDQFSIPRDEGPSPDPGELSVLAQWLSDYIADARAQDNPYFTAFNQIATDENWAGILILKADITAMPATLAGLQGGMDLDRFNAHHLGIAISQINGETVDLMESSSMFGLIYYVDEAYDQATGKAVPPLANADYDFKVLTLKALFANTAVRQFESRAQLTMNKIFGEKVQRMRDPANIYNTVMLNGSLQHQNGHSFYILDCEDDNIFCFDSNVLRQVEIVKAQFNTTGTSADGQTTNARFDLWGYADFRILQQKPDKPEGAPKPLDLFSFGGPDGPDPDPARQGLRFSGLGLNMSFPSHASAGETQAKRTFLFDASKIAFDPAQSTPRDMSVYNGLSLELDSMVSGAGDSTPADQGYLPVGTDLRLVGVSGPWYGLRFRVNLGTPGALAGKANLNALLLAAWSPGSPTDPYSYNVTVGLSLPGTGGGAKLLSLQGVLKLSIGDIRLTFVEEQQAYLLTLTQIALQFLGLLKLPPNGSSSFYLFGNPNKPGTPNALGWYAIYNQEKPKQSLQYEGGATHVDAEQQTQ